MLVALMNVALMLGALVVLGCLWTWEQGRKNRSRLLSIAAPVLLALVLVAEACLGFHAMKYYFLGETATAYPSCNMAARSDAGEAGMKEGKMMGGMRMGQKKEPEAPAVQADHDKHH